MKTLLAKIVSYLTYHVGRDLDWGCDRHAIEFLGLTFHSWYEANIESDKRIDLWFQLRFRSKHIRRWCQTVDMVE